MARSLLLASLALAVLPTSDGVRHHRRPVPKLESSPILEEQASLVSEQANVSYTPNTGCQGRVELHYTYGDTLDNCGGQYETEMNDPLSGGSHKKQPPHGGWFMVSTTSRRRHRWYCSNSWESQDCGGGSCMQVWHHSRRRFPINCGQCTCHQPRAVRSSVCLDLLYSVAGDSNGTIERTVSWTVGTNKESYTQQDTVHEAAVAASASIDGAIPQIGGVFGVTADTRYTVTSAFSSAYSESYTSEYSVSEKLTLDVSQSVYILVAKNFVYFEDGSNARLSGRTLLQFPELTRAGCQDIWTSP